MALHRQQLVRRPQWNPSRWVGETRPTGGSTFASVDCSPPVGWVDDSTKARSFRQPSPSILHSGVTSRTAPTSGYISPEKLQRIPRGRFLVSRGVGTGDSVASKKNMSSVGRSTEYITSTVRYHQRGTDDSCASRRACPELIGLSYTYGAVFSLENIGSCGLMDKAPSS